VYLDEDGDGDCVVCGHVEVASIEESRREVASRTIRDYEGRYQRFWDDAHRRRLASQRKYEKRVAAERKRAKAAI